MLLPMDEISQCSPWSDDRVYNDSSGPKIMGISFPDQGINLQLSVEETWMLCFVK